MLLRRTAARISTVVVAIVVALAVPVSQLRTVMILKMCCCPDPDSCHCPDHKTDSPSQPSMKECHGSERAIVAPQAPSFVAPAISVAAAPPVVIAAVEHALPSPHPAPPPTRPDAPS